MDKLGSNTADCELGSLTNTPDELDYEIYDKKKVPTPISLENSLSYSIVSVSVDHQPKKLETILEQDNEETGCTKLSSSTVKSKAAIPKQTYKKDLKKHKRGGGKKINIKNVQNDLKDLSSLTKNVKKDISFAQKLIKMDSEEDNSLRLHKKTKLKSKFLKMQSQMFESEAEISSTHIDYYKTDNLSCLENKLNIQPLANTNLDLTFDQKADDLIEDKCLISEQKKEELTDDFKREYRKSQQLLVCSKEQSQISKIELSKYT